MTISPHDHRDTIFCRVLLSLEFLGQAQNGKYGGRWDLVPLGIPWHLWEWLDRRPARTERRAFCRLAEQMEADGQLVRVAGGLGDRMTHCRPTADMLRAAPEVVGDAPDWAAIARGLAVTDWGKELVEVAREIGGAADE